MKEKLFPEIKKYEYKANAIQDEERIIYQYPIIYEYLSKKVKGYGVSSFLKSNGFYNVCLYAVTEFTDILISDIENAKDNIRIIAVGDLHPEKYSFKYKSYSVVGIEKVRQMYENKEIDGVMVCSVFHEYEIIKQLIYNGINAQDVLSFNSYVFE